MLIATEEDRLTGRLEVLGLKAQSFIEERTLKGILEGIQTPGTVFTIQRDETIVGVFTIEAKPREDRDD